MAPEEEQKLRNFRLLGGGSSMELPQQQQQPTAPLLGQGPSQGGFGTNPNQFFGPGSRFRDTMARDGVMAFRADTGERARDFEERAVMNYANMGNRSPQPNMPLLGQGAGEQGMSPEILAGLGLGGGIVAGQVGGSPSTSMRLSPFAQRIADLDASRLAQQGRPNLIGTPQTTTTTPRMVGPNTSPQYTGPSPARPVPGTQMVPTGQPPAVGSQGGSPAVRPAQVTSVNTVPRGGPPALLGQASRLSRAAGPTALYTLADVGVEAATGQGISSRVGEGLGGLIGSAIYGDTSQPAFTQEELAASIANNPQQPIDLGTLERQSAPAPEDDPIRSTFTLPNGEVVMERESGERFTPTADQLQSFNSAMQSVSQPTATGMGVGGDEGVVFGGGQAPMSAEATQAMLEERFGAPTISAIQSLPAGQGSGMQTDAQGRMIDPNVDRSEFDRASAEREARLAERDRRPGESQAQRDTRIADSRTQGASSGGLTMEAATRLTGGDRDAARTIIEQQRQGMGQFDQFEPREFEIGGQKYIQLSPNYIQPVPQEEAPFEPRTREIGGVTYVEESPGRFKPLPSQGTATADADTPILVDPIDSIPTITSPSEYEKLPKGSKYRDSEGKLATKR